MKEAKATKFAVEPIRKILIAEEISDGGTQKAAAALEGTWIQINETMFVFMEEGVATLVYRDEYETGCACDHFKDSENVLCEHIVAFEDLSHKPQLSIESKECRWLQEYLFSLGWYTENRYLYPSLDAKLPEDEATTEPEVVAELPPVQESPKLDPVNADKPLDTGVDEPKMATFICNHCGQTIEGVDPVAARKELVDHQAACPKNPANMKTKPGGEEKTTVHYECPKCGEEVDIYEENLREWKLNHMDVCKGKTETNPSEIPNSSKPPTTEKPNVAKSAPVKKTDGSKTPLIDTIKKYVGNDVLEIFGDTGSGKSKFALEIAREAISAGLKVFYLDSERNLTDEDVKMLGNGYKYTPVLKEIDDTIRKLPAVDVVVIDSIGFPILTAYARYNMKQKGDALLTMIAMFGDLKQWAYRNNGLVVVVNQPESTFNKEAGHILRPFGDKSQFAAKEIWWLKMVKRADKTPDHHTEILITSFRGRTLGYGDKLYTMNIRHDGIEFIPVR